MVEPDAPLEPGSYIPRQVPEQPRSSFPLAVFWGPSGLRAGWRLLIFFSILAALFGAGILASHVMGRHRGAEEEFTAPRLLIGELFLFIVVLIATRIMAGIEGRRVADYGLPVPRAAHGRFWRGAAMGIASITILLGVLHLAGAFHFGTIGLHGARAWKYGILWGIVFLFVGLFEELFFRGYVQFTLMTGIGFWPAAVLTSILFGYVHHSNSGETQVGTVSAGAVGFLFCLLLRRTGDLWMPIGFHAAWDWGETYLYGVPDSGQVAPGHLFNASFSGPQWITGGTVGPEGSWFCLFLIVILYLAVAIWLRKAKYPDPVALDTPGSLLRSLKT